MISAISNKTVTLNWVVIDLNSSRKVFNYQKIALSDLGFSVTIAGSIFKHYEGKEAILADSENIRNAYDLISARFPQARGAVITDKQFGNACDLQYLPLATESQKQLFKNIIK